VWSQGFDRFGEFGLAGYVAVLGVDEGGGGEVVEVRERSRLRGRGVVGLRGCLPW
jgi:hypothetical protein